MNIGQAARASGLAAKMTRYYEAIGLVPGARRLENGYRGYDATDVHRLQFIRCARDVGLSLDCVRELLGLWSDRARSSSEVKAATLAHIAHLEARAADLADMIKTMQRAVKRRLQPARMKSAGRR